QPRNGLTNFLHVGQPVAAASLRDIPISTRAFLVSPITGIRLGHPSFIDFGPGENYDRESGIPTIQPPIINGVLPVYGTKVNADGNEVTTGMPTVLGEAPLGTYVGWNPATTGWYGPNASNGPGSVGQVFAGAGNSGGYWPFWDTQTNRMAAGDPRL